MSDELLNGSERVAELGATGGGVRRGGWRSGARAQPERSGARRPGGRRADRAGWVVAGLCTALDRGVVAAADHG